MERFLSPLSLPSPAGNELARALGIDPRRATIGVVRGRRRARRRNSLEPIVPNWRARELESGTGNGSRRGSTTTPSTTGLSAEDLHEYTSLSSLTLNQVEPSTFVTRASMLSCAKQVRSPGSAQQWSLLCVVRVPGVREDYYSTLVASACTQYPQDGDDWAFMHESSCYSFDEDLLSLNRLGEVILAASLYACRWTPQLGPQLFRHFVEGEVTCIAVTRLGFCVMGDQEGNLLLFDLVQDPPPLLIRQRLHDIVDFSGCQRPVDAHARANVGGKQHAMHVVWSDNTPETQRAALARCGYRVEFFVGTNRGEIFKMFVTTSFSFAAEIISPPPTRHKDGISAMAFDYNQDVLVVAGIDSIVSVWTHLVSTQGMTSLTYQYRFQAYSAVKGLAFCPGLVHLIALGGGRRDRALRIYDIDARRVMRTVAMPAQIVGVVWLSRWEVLVAMGHSRLKGYKGLAKVYNLATGRIVCDIPGSGYALCAVKTTRGASIYTSQNYLMEFSWAPETSPKPSSEVLAALRVSYPPAALR